MASSTTPTRPTIKRLTLDLPSDVHRALKVRSVELDVPMAELLRKLIDRALAEPSAMAELADRCRESPGNSADSRTTTTTASNPPGRSRA